ncbi:MAG TPA: hypothetical protein VMG10_13300, partial [Gemmataceae bacterium]|nr:hypothetical protein [Gemmataceae bacterium]
MSHLAPLFLAGSLAAVVLFLGLLVRQMAALPHAGKPVVERSKLARVEQPPPRQNLLVIDARKEHAELVEKTRVPVSQPEAKSPAAVSSHRPEPLTADQIFEQRLQVGEDELRRQLCDVLELRLLSDEDVRAFREKEKVARMTAGRAANVDPPSLPRINSRTNPVGAVIEDFQNALAKEDRAIWATIPGEEKAIRAAVSAQERQIRSAAVINAEEQTSYQFNRSLQETLRQAASRAGLALQSGPACELAPDVAEEVADLSKDLRRLGVVMPLGIPSPRQLVRQGRPGPLPMPPPRPAALAARRYAQHKAVVSAKATYHETAAVKRA